MNRPKPLWMIFVVLLVVAAAALSYGYAVHTDRAAESHGLAYSQAVLAFGHLKTYERIQSLLERKCFEAALTEAKELKNLQARLVSENLLATNNHPELVDYIRTRDPQLLEAILAGRLPEGRSYTTTCP